MPQHDLYSDVARVPRLVLGVVANNPVSNSDGLYVTIPSWPGNDRWGPCPWTPHQDGLPGVGTQCLLAFPDDGPVPWIIAWIGPWVDYDPYVHV